MSGTLRPLSAICGAAVADAAGAPLGAIEDVMIDEATGAIAYVVLKTGGVLGVGEQLHAAPWQALRFGTDGALSIPVDAAQAAEWQGFDKDA